MHLRSVARANTSCWDIQRTVSCIVPSLEREEDTPGWSVMRQAGCEATGMQEGKKKKSSHVYLSNPLLASPWLTSPEYCLIQPKACWSLLMFEIEARVKLLAEDHTDTSHRWQEGPSSRKPALLWLGVNWPLDEGISETKLSLLPLRSHSQTSITQVTLSSSFFATSAPSLAFLAGFPSAGSLLFHTLVSKRNLSTTRNRKTISCQIIKLPSKQIW